MISATVCAGALVGVLKSWMSCPSELRLRSVEGGEAHLRRRAKFRGGPAGQGRQRSTQNRNPCDHRANIGHHIQSAGRREPTWVGEIRSTGGRALLWDSPFF
jgi:hypothetical protein